MNEVAEELGRAIQAHGPIRSAHEGYAVVLEEVRELEREVFCRERRAEALRAEAIQVAAMAVRLVADVLDGGATEVADGRRSVVVPRLPAPGVSHCGDDLP